MNLKCIDVIESLTKERIYKHNDTSRDDINCYYLRGDDGVKRFYLKSRFEEVKEMLNGKFVICDILSGIEDINIGDIIEFENGNGITKGFKWVRECEDVYSFNYNSFVKIKPYEKPKEFLTIGMLEFRKDKKSYKDSSGKTWSIVGGNMYSDDDEDITRIKDLDGILKMRFTEINPNKERIDFLKKEIEKLSVGKKGKEKLYRELKDVISALECLLNSYEVELKELEGQE